jgi:hypothetical protein
MDCIFSTHWRTGLYTEFWLQNLKRRNSLETSVCCKVNIRIDYRETGEAGVTHHCNYLLWSHSAGADISLSHHIQTGPGVHPSSHPMVTSGGGVNLTNHSI